MNTLNSKFIEELGWELISQDEYFMIFRKVGTTDVYFTYNLKEGGDSIIYQGETNYAFYFNGKIKTGQFLIDLLESIF